MKPGHQQAGRHQQLGGGRQLRRQRAGLRETLALREKGFSLPPPLGLGLCDRGGGPLSSRSTPNVLFRHHPTISGPDAAIEVAVLAVLFPCHGAMYYENQLSLLIA
jgi:hypothetical protein